MVANPFGPTPDDRIYFERLRQIREVRDKVPDPSWIHNREPEIHALLLECIHRAPFFYPAVQLLDELLPVLKGHANYPRWQYVVLEAIVNSGELSTERLKAEIFLHFGEFMLNEGDHLAARRAADIAQSRVVETGDIDTQLRCYILFLQTQPQRDYTDLKQETIYKALQLAKKLPAEHPTRAALYQALAAFYAYRHNLRASNSYLRSALRLWKRMGNLRGKIDCAVIRAHNARTEQRYHQVNRVLKILENHVCSNGTLLLHGYLLYTRAAGALEQSHVEQAIRDWSDAREKFQKVLTLPMVANCDHSLALTYGAHNEVRKAKRHLAKARRIWRRLGAGFRLIDIQIAQTYLERMSGNLLGAMLLLSQASAAAEKIDNKDIRHILEDSIADEARKIGDAWDAQGFSP